MKKIIEIFNFPTGKTAKKDELLSSEKLKILLQINLCSSWILLYFSNFNGEINQENYAMISKNLKQIKKLIYYAN